MFNFQNVWLTWSLKILNHITIYLLVWVLWILQDDRSQWQNESKMAHHKMDDGENGGVAGVASVLSCFNAPHDSRPRIEERMAGVSAVCCTNVGWVEAEKRISNEVSNFIVFVVIFKLDMLTSWNRFEALHSFFYKNNFIRTGWDFAQIWGKIKNNLRTMSGWSFELFIYSFKNNQADFHFMFLAF